jgi:hypothetical protein
VSLGLWLNNVTVTASRPDGCGNDTAIGVWLPQPSPWRRPCALRREAAVTRGAPGARCR